MDPTGGEGESPDKTSPPERARGHRAPAWLRALARSRTAHFFLLGSCIFAISPAPDDGREIHLAEERLAAIRAAEARRLGKAALSPEETRDVDARAVEDELLYREAIRLRIAEGDVVVRQRLIQKLLILAEDMAGASTPLTDDELRACFTRSPDRWRLPAEARLVHIYSSAREQLAPLLEQARAWSSDPAQKDEIPPLGESFPLSRRIAARVDKIEADYGADFASALKNLPLHAWSEPVASKFGWHLVRVLDYQAERPAALDDVRGELALHCQIARREEAVRQYLAGLLPDYRVYIDGERVRELSRTGRVAPRGEPSAED